MAVFRRAAVVALWLVGGLAVAPGSAAAQPGECHVVDVDFVAAESPNEPAMRFGLQMVAWLETPGGQFLDTVFITRQAGLFGLGNRPGRFDFNSGPGWPYGSRLTLFPVWSHRHGLSFPQVVFQNDKESDLSHPFNQSSRETHYCRPLLREEAQWDAGSCASTIFTDKGVLSQTATSRYPPRNDVSRATPDHPSVDMFATLNPFDAISQASPVSNAATLYSWPIPTELPLGDYVLFVEVAREFDMNATYNETVFPAPSGIFYGDYGLPYRGQPSLIYRVPFTVGADITTTATTLDYIGYGAPDGTDGAIRPPDATITGGVAGSGAGRLALTSDGYRLRVVSRNEDDATAPAAPGALVASTVTGTSATFAFVAPGDDGMVGRVKGYDVRFRVGEDITEANFDDSSLVAATIGIGEPGTSTTFTLDGLLPETTYSIGIRAVDDCRNIGPLTIRRFSTADRAVGEVDACFVATAAYGSVLANDVEMLRRFRDLLLQRTAIGELAVETYYTFGPAVAGVVGESDLLRATARAALRPIVERVRGFKL